MRTTGLVLVAAAMVLLGTTGARAADMPGQVTAVDVTEFYISTDNIVIKGVTNEAYPQDTPAHQRGCRVFVNGFVTYTSPTEGGWRICIPRREVGSLMDPTTKVHLVAIDLRTGAVAEKDVPLTGLAHQDEQMQKFEQVAAE